MTLIRKTNAQNAVGINMARVRARFSTCVDHFLSLFRATNFLFIRSLGDSHKRNSYQLFIAG